MVDLTQAWIPERTYPFRAIVVRDGAVWCATRATRNEVPGSGDAWYRLKEPGVDKATMAESIDERIGQGV